MLQFLFEEDNTRSLEIYPPDLARILLIFRARLLNTCRPCRFGFIKLWLTPLICHGIVINTTTQHSRRIEHEETINNSSIIPRWPFHFSFDRVIPESCHAG